MLLLKVKVAWADGYRELLSLSSVRCKHHNRTLLDKALWVADIYVARHRLDAESPIVLVGSSTDERLSRKSLA